MTITETQAPPTDPTSPAPRSRATLLRIVAALLAVVLVGLVVLSLVELKRAHTANAKEAAGKAAVAAAVTEFPKAFSYSYATIDADMARAKSVFTPALQKDYTKIFGSLVQTLQQQKVVVTLIIQQAQAISVDSATSVRALVFFTQTTSKPSSTSAGATTGAYALTMTKLNGKWLIGAANAAA